MAFAHQVPECTMEGTRHIIPASAQIALGPIAPHVPPSVTINLVVSSVVPLMHLSFSIQVAVILTNGHH